ncbi:MAG TPA: Gfo/Idh/MocA family oxidoreductase [Gemmatales bacterium]|nr:Gfo/Idh/MocA family oxidoreductase [Gemmatales bacterium]
MKTQSISRRQAMKAIAAGLTAPMVFRSFAHATPSETVLHVSVGSGGMAASDIGSLTASKNLRLVAIADVDSIKAAEMAKKHPGVKIYQDWRVMFEKETFDSVNVSTPDHMHAAPTMRAIRMGKAVYTQKPLTQTIYEARQLANAAAGKNTISQMGIQIHSASEHKTAVATIQSGAIGKVKEVHSWSGKDWGDPRPRPDRHDPIPPTFNWDLWLGIADERPFLGNGYYHPGNWRKRLDFGTGTFGDMGCHILDPVFGSLGVKYANAVKSIGEAPNEHNWPLHCEVIFTFPGSQFTTDSVTVHWYNGNRRPSEEIVKLIEPHKLPGQGSIYLGTDGVMFSPYIGMPVLLGSASAKKVTPIPSNNHYLQFVDAVRGKEKTSAPFSYAGPLSEMVLLGCLATRFPQQMIEWDAAKMQSSNFAKANDFVQRRYRKGWEEQGISR